MFEKKDVKSREISLYNTTVSGSKKSLLAVIKYNMNDGVEGSIINCNFRSSDQLFHLAAEIEKVAEEINVWEEESEFKGYRYEGARHYVYVHARDIYEAFKKISKKLPREHLSIDFLQVYDKRKQNYVYVLWTE